MSESSERRCVSLVNVTLSLQPPRPNMKQKRCTGNVSFFRTSKQGYGFFAIFDCINCELILPFFPPSIERCIRIHTLNPS